VAGRQQSVFFYIRCCIVPLPACPLNLLDQLIYGEHVGEERAQGCQTRPLHFGRRKIAHPAVRRAVAEKEDSKVARGGKFMWGLLSPIVLVTRFHGVIRIWRAALRGRREASGMCPHAEHGDELFAREDAVFKDDGCFAILIDAQADDVDLQCVFCHTLPDEAE
jgi:hypothetical protein